MRRTAWAVFFFSLILGCGSSGDATDAGADTAGPPPACSSDLATTDQACGSLSWTTSSTLSSKRNHHVTLVTRAQDGSAFLVVVAGGDGGMGSKSVEIAPIAADGSLGAFAPGPDYGLPVGGLTGVNANGVLVGAGGNEPLGNVDAVFTSVVQPDGSLAPWKAQTTMNEARMHPASFAIGSRVWVLGGFNAIVQKDAIFADVAPDGTIAAWNPAGDLPGPLSHFSVAYARGFVYVTGGLDKLPTTNPPPKKDVWRGAVEPDGTLDDWTAMTPMPVGICTHASFVYGGWLYVAGGIDAKPSELAAVRRAPIQDDGTLGDWETAASLPLARAHVHQLPVVGTHVYSVAGATDFSLNSTNAVFVGSFL